MCFDVIPSRHLITSDPEKIIDCKTRHFFFILLYRHLLKQLWRIFWRSGSWIWIFPPSNRLIIATALQRICWWHKLEFKSCGGSLYTRCTWKRGKQFVISLEVRHYIAI